MSRNESYFIQQYDKRFGRYDVADEGVHLQFKSEQPHYALTETQYFGFSIPEHEIHAFLYLWYHPNLKVVSAGPLVFQGIKTISLAAELFDYRNFMPDSQFPRGLTSFQLDNSYEVQMLEPGRVFRVKYSDSGRRNSFDILYTAVSDPMVWASSRHFEQVMKVEGELTLRGKHYDVGGFNVRDRSWGEARLETPVEGPSVSWMTGVFDEGFSFNVTCLDHPDLNPIWADTFSVDPAKAHKNGWIIVDGEPLIIESARKRSTYDRDSLIQQSTEVEVRDTRGRVFNIKGRVVAAAPFNTWPNLRVPICLTRWECNGKVGWGDIQEAQWTDFLSAYHRPRANGR
jgi:hypothetical protein